MIELGHHIVLAKQYVGSISGLYIDQSARFAAADNDVYHSPQAAVAIAKSVRAACSAGNIISSV